ncbi:hypothetical protein CDAR_70821 [Caerostris darwini]|uniref:Uncharacterized protein n=1 Tax=Caerostris darwini TaxID=1538125 RepID=A0AAV4WG39_9ARAC|nr:hypothetical protein CDAR_70821 [Caerostris darwini]
MIIALKAASIRNMNTEMKRGIVETIICVRREKKIKHSRFEVKFPRQERRGALLESRATTYPQKIVATDNKTFSKILPSRKTSSSQSYNFKRDFRVLSVRRKRPP